jgi:uncharacterized glyoxalase superfamily protein PhnB
MAAWPTGQGESLSPDRRDSLIANGVQASDIDVQPWGSLVTFADPEGNTWALQQLPPRP